MPPLSTASPPSQQGFAVSSGPERSRPHSVSHWHWTARTIVLARVRALTPPHPNLAPPLAWAVELEPQRSNHGSI
ncbi:hypothetical protein A1O3_00046 [Capronia epimyces CBS 606.96]|uniref:Uncharacterized protein n=1 Tax=Capronia epimyces CBS 606.96 TaxID=1182542 RepID=W9YG41_9EURO|nr:uncharacterized protein A1O3_00046 [Capronia epimyces CBS 606.96]EXJ91498.1 hypothetical protein A1O3_00046 [Capronia epimyces CBS 606.96]